MARRKNAPMRPLRDLPGQRIQRLLLSMKKKYRNLSWGKMSRRQRPRICLPDRDRLEAMRVSRAWSWTLDLGNPLDKETLVATVITKTVTTPHLPIAWPRNWTIALNHDPYRSDDLADYRVHPLLRWGWPQIYKRPTSMEDLGE